MNGIVGMVWKIVSGKKLVLQNHGGEPMSESETANRMPTRSTWKMTTAKLTHSYNDGSSSTSQFSLVKRPSAVRCTLVLNNTTPTERQRETFFTMIFLTRNFAMICLTRFRH